MYHECELECDRSGYHGNEHYGKQYMELDEDSRCRHDSDHEWHNEQPKCIRLRLRPKHFPMVSQ
jgi:hypothetical protein